jgi:hypothetical protein
VTATGARIWILHATIDGERRDMGLGGFPDASLAIARQAARDARAKISSGRDPIEEGRAARAALAETRAAAATFERAATLYVEAQESGWRGAKHAVQWRTAMETYAYPVISAMNVDAVKRASRGDDQPAPPRAARRRACAGPYGHDPHQVAQNRRGHRAQHPTSAGTAGFSSPDEARLHHGRTRAGPLNPIQRCPRRADKQQG